MSIKSLPGDKFIVDFIHPMFRANNDSEMFTQMIWISFFYTLSVVATMALLPAPYGRYSSSRFGFLLPGKFAWITQESPAIIVPIVLLWATSSTCWNSAANKILWTAFVIHYFQRSIIFPLTTRSAKESPFLVCISAFTFCLFNGFMQSHYLLNYHQYDDSWATSPQFVIGMSMFCLGMAINVYSDQLLINLRKPGETGYKIPVGGMFNYVTGGNFFGEIVEWIGYAIASCSLPSAIFALFTACYLGMRAWHHHNYYLSKFENYPCKRKIIIPYLF